MARFRLQLGMFLVITKVLPYETPEIVGWSWEYEDVWNYWIDNPERELDLAMVQGNIVETPGGKHEYLQVWRIEKPIPPSRYAARLTRKQEIK